MAHNSSNVPRLPLVVQLGFAGSRELWDAKAPPNGDKFLAAVENHLKNRLTQLRDDLELSDYHFLCGISQVAIGADTLFTRACQELDIPQRIFLPQSRDEYFSATSSKRDTPDFTDDEKRIALQLLHSHHIINERVVSVAADRGSRFEEVNIEIARVSDAAICLVRADADADARPGGTHDLIKRAKSRNKPVLVIIVEVNAKDGTPQFTEEWHWPEKEWIAPQWHHAFEKMTAPPNASSLLDATLYFKTVKDFASVQAKSRSNLFKMAALIIIGTHILATVCATGALAFHEMSALPWLLGLELLLLAGGFGVHQYLHKAEASQVWAVSRLVAELIRSVSAVGPLHLYLDYLFDLPFPHSLRPLLRTLNVLHLRNTRPTQGEPWEPIRDNYVANRLNGDKGQLTFYSREMTKAETGLKRAHWTFMVCSVAAFLFTSIKLAGIPLIHLGYIPMSDEQHGIFTSVFGSLAIISPVLAVAGLSLAAAFDLEARANTFKEMHEFLEAQEKLLQKANTKREFARLLLETESRLLGETVNWFSRRSFTGVA